MEIHEIISENGRVTKDEYRDITPAEAITKIANVLASGQKIAMRSNSVQEDIISVYKGKETRAEHFCFLFDNEDETREKLVAALKNIKTIQWF